MILQAAVWIILLFVVAAVGLTAVQLALWSRMTYQVDGEPSLSWLMGLFLAFMGTVIFVGWTGVVLVSFGQFSLLNVTLAALFLGGGLWLWKRPFASPKFQTLHATELGLLLLMLGAAIVYFRPHEYVLGGIDPGVYVNIAANAVRTGEFHVNDEWSANLVPFADVTLREQPPQWRSRYLQFVGWYLDDKTPGRIIPQFFPFHSMLVAVGISLGGLFAGLLVTPVWGVLSLTAVYYTTRQLFNEWVGILTAVFLAITPTHIYFARYPTTEPLTLLLVFTGLLAFQKLWDNEAGKELWGILMGISFGAAFLTRIDLPVVAILLVGFLFLRWWQNEWHKGWTLAAVALSTLMAHAAVSAWLLNAPYVWNTYGGVATLLGGSTVVIGVGVVGVTLAVGCLVLIWRTEWQTFVASPVGRFLRSRRLRWMIAISVVAISLFAYFVRPIIQPVVSYPSWPTGAEAFLLDGENWVRLGWYLTPLGLALATIGLAIIVLRYSLNRFGFFLFVGGLSIIQYVYRIFNTPYHIYAMRRYVPIVIPVLVVFAAVALWLLFQQERRWIKVATVVIGIGLFGGLLYQARFVLPLRDLEGATAQLVQVANAIEPDAILVISEPATSTFADTFGPPLRFIYGHDIATIRQGGVEAEAYIQALQALAEAQKRPLQLLSTSAIDPVVKEVFALEPVAFLPVRLPKLRNTYTDYPSVNQTVYYGIEVYNLAPAGNDLDTAETVLIDIGSIDTAYIVDGFYGKEPLPGEVTVRWTQETAVLEIPNQEADQLLIEVQARIFRPEGVPPAPVIVTLDDQILGEFVPERALTAVSFQAPINTEDETSMLQFTTTTFSPAEINGSGDQRDLGFLLDWVQITVKE
ncbi:MAG: glycosyltransferase family 39 protein [Chloroflexota bacterium]